MPEVINPYGLVNKPPIDEIYNLDLVNKPDLSSDELAHFGILGMKWGVRRYQNPDGTLTAEGKLRLNKKQQRREARIRRRINRAHKKEEQRKKRFEKKKKQIMKNPDQIIKYQDLFTTDELYDAKKRIELMNNFKQLKADKIYKGRQIVDNILKYGDTANKALEFVNSPLGRGIRKKMGLDDRKILDYTGWDKKKEDAEKAAKEKRQRAEADEKARKNQDQMIEAFKKALDSHDEDQRRIYDENRRKKWRRK